MLIVQAEKVPDPPVLAAVIVIVVPETETIPST
jgi:hypothetical protein